MVAKKKDEKPIDQKRFDDALTHLLKAPPQHRTAKKKDKVGKKS